MQESITASRKAFIDVTRHSCKIYLNLLKVMVPIIILVKIATEVGLLNYLALPLEPVMELVGLPPLIGLAFAAGLLSGINSAILLYVSLLPQLGTLSVADISVFSVMLLIAHGLPVEGRLTSHCGVSFWWHVLLRLSTAFAAALLLRQIYTHTGFGAQDAQLLWTPPVTSFANPLLAWLAQQLYNFGMMFLIIYVIMLAMRLLKALNLLRLLDFALAPLLRLLGISRNASTITVIGMLAGLLYGSGLIKAEVALGKVSKQDVFFALSFMAIAHSIVEDTMLLLLIGADFNGIFWFRLAFAMLVTAAMVATAKRVPSFKKSYA